MTEGPKRAQDGDAMPTRGMSRAARIGWMMALFLAVQTSVEYILFLVVDSNLPIMVVLNLTEAAAIMIYFMHIPRLWRGREAE